MARFGTYLLECGALTRAQLEEATQCQVVFGGRLGTNLVELGYLRLDELERHLSGHLGVPVAPTAWIEAPYQDALDAVSADLAGRHAVLPLALEKRTLHAAMLDPNHPERIDDIAFATGLRVRPYLLSELRLSALLEHHYGIPRDTRYINLGPEAARGRHAAPRGGKDAAQAAPEIRREEPADLIDEATFTALHAGWNLVPGSADARADASFAAKAPSAPARRSRPRPSPRTTAPELERALARATHRDEVGVLALQWATLYCDAAALFVVRGGMISGFRGDGAGIPENLDGLLVPVAADTVLAAAATGRAVRGAPPAGGLDARVYAALGRTDVHESLVIPVVIRDRVINLLYADAADTPLADTDVAALTALGRCVGEAYERLVIEGKRIAGIAPERRV